MLLKMQTRNKNANFTQSKQFYGTSSHCHDNYCISDFFFLFNCKFTIKRRQAIFFKFFSYDKNLGSIISPQGKQSNTLVGNNSSTILMSLMIIYSDVNETKCHVQTKMFYT